MDKTLNGLIDYIRASYSIRVMRRLETPNASVAKALSMIKNPTVEINADINANLRAIYNKYYANAKTAEEQQEIRVYCENLERQAFDVGFKTAVQLWNQLDNTGGIMK